MQKRSYFDTALYSIKNIKENPVLYLPDLIFAVATLILAILFLYLNNLTIIFSGLELFANKIKEIIISKSALAKLLVSLAVFVLLNLLVGLGIIIMRYSLIKMVVKNEKVSFSKAYKEAHKYFMSVIGLKLTFLGIYLVPIIVLLGIGLAYKKLQLLMIILLVLVLIIIRLVFLFTYAILFLKTGKGALATIKESINYFNNNKKHVIFTGLFVGLFGFIMTLILKLIPNNLDSFVGLSTLTITFFIIKTLVEITFMTWSNLFIFKNY